MRTIWKYPLEIADRQVVRMPSGAQVLSAQVQHGQLCLWAIVDDDRDVADTQVHIAGTGHPLDAINPSWRHVGTVQMLEGRLVFHVFVQ